MLCHRATKPLERGRKERALTMATAAVAKLVFLLRLQLVDLH
jgi:hypothetical protein